MTQATAAPDSWRVPRLLGLVLALGLPAEELRAGGKHSSPTTLTVTATAYSSSPKQTDHTPFHGAWGDRLDALPDGQRAIAVSRDLAAKGLERGTLVSIDGQDDTFVVLDRTPARWTNRIDIYMGMDTRAARHWGRKKVKISWDGRVAMIDEDDEDDEEEEADPLNKPQRD